MIFTRYGTRWRIDEFGALWWDADEQPAILRAYCHDAAGSSWFRWCGIDV